MNDQNQTKPFDTRVKSWQVILDFVRSVIFSTLLILFLVYPDGVWFFLEKAKLDIKELQIFGAKLEKVTAETTIDLANALNDANIANDNLKKELSKTSDSLVKVKNCFSNAESLAVCANDKSIVNQIEKQQKQADQAQQNAQHAAGAIETILSSNAKFIEKSESTITAADGVWGVIFGGDVSRLAAEDEIRKAQKLNIQRLAIYNRQKSFRSVALFDNREEASKTVSILKQINAGAYVVELTRWCSDRQKMDFSNDYTFFVCQSQ